MTEIDGNQILTGLSETRRFLEQVSLLIQTAEDVLRAKGWDTPFGNKCTHVSGGLYHPEKWMPAEVYRFFVVDEDSEENSDLVLFVGVLLDSETAWSGFTEPWVTCGLYRFDTEKSAVRRFSHWDWVHAILDDKHDADGVFHDYQFSPEEQEECDGLVYQSIMALPLTAIDSAQALERKIVEPLLERVRLSE